MGGEAAFVYDFGTLYDYVERQGLHVSVTLDPETPAHRILVKGRGLGTIEQPVADCDFDGAAARLAGKLRSRGVTLP